MITKSDLTIHMVEFHSTGKVKLLAAVDPRHILPTLEYWVVGPIIEEGRLVVEIQTYKAFDDALAAYNASLILADSVLCYNADVAETSTKPGEAHTAERTYENMGQDYYYDYVFKPNSGFVKWEELRPESRKAYIDEAIEFYVSTI